METTHCLRCGNLLSPEGTCPDCGPRGTKKAPLYPLFLMIFVVGIVVSVLWSVISIYNAHKEQQRLLDLHRGPGVYHSPTPE